MGIKGTLEFHKESKMDLVDLLGGGSDCDCDYSLQSFWREQNITLWVWCLLNIWWICPDCSELAIPGESRRGQVGCQESHSSLQSPCVPSPLSPGLGTLWTPWLISRLRRSGSWRIDPQGGTWILHGGGEERPGYGTAFWAVAQIMEPSSADQPAKIVVQPLNIGTRNSVFSWMVCRSQI